MMLLRLLNPQGIAGLAAALVLALLLIVQKGETRHWKKQSGQLEQLYREEQTAYAGTVANYRAAAERARASDQANAERVVAEQGAINERTANDYQARLAAARTLAQRLRLAAASAAADPGARGAAPVPGLSAASGRSSESAGEDGLSQSDRLLATEQAIQLDELIEWVRRQHGIDSNGALPAAAKANGQPPTP